MSEAKKQDETIEESQKTLEGYRADIEALKAKAVHYSDEMKAEFDKRLNELETLYSEAQERYDALKDRTESKWEETKAFVVLTQKALIHSYRYFLEELRVLRLLPELLLPSRLFAPFQRGIRRVFGIGKERLAVQNTPFVTRVAGLFQEITRIAVLMRTGPAAHITSSEFLPIITHSAGKAEAKAQESIMTPKHPKAVHGARRNHL
jgi:hypothetical protein